MICSKCLLDSSISNITFNEEEVCNFCLELGKRKSFQKPSENELNKLIEKIKANGRNKKYDCIIGLSGGVDSSYVAYVVKKLGLRPLAVHLDNGWDTELAVSNIYNICKELDIELYTYVINWNEFRDIQKSFLKASLANAEIPTDHAIVAIIYKMARKFKLKYIIDGVNSATETSRIGFNEAGYTYGDLYHLKAIHRRFGQIKIKSFPTISYLEKSIYKFILGIRQISILNYIDYNKQEAIKLLINRYNWKSYGGKHHESLFTKFHQVIYLPEKFHFDKRRLHLSDLLLSGQISRENALEELSTPPISQEGREELIGYFKKKMSLSDQEFSALMCEKPRSYTEYPNRDWILKLYQKYLKFKNRK